MPGKVVTNFTIFSKVFAKTAKITKNLKIVDESCEIYWRDQRKTASPRRFFAIFAIFPVLSRTLLEPHLHFSIDFRRRIFTILQAKRKLGKFLQFCRCVQGFFIFLNYFYYLNTPHYLQLQCIT